jgi:hypothetical protein
MPRWREDQLTQDNSALDVGASPPSVAVSGARRSLIVTWQRLNENASILVPLLDALTTAEGLNTVAEFITHSRVNL